MKNKNLCEDCKLNGKVDMSSNSSVSKTEAVYYLRQSGIKYKDVSKNAGVAL